MLMLEKGINWNDIPTWMKRGTCAIRNPIAGSPTEFVPPILADEEIPIFTQDRDYIGKHLVVGE